MGAPSLRRHLFLLMLCATLSLLARPCRGWAGDHASVAHPAAATQYTKRLWRVRDGLPEDTVQAIAQSADGHLWIGTTGGLARFDGSSFTLFGQNSAPALQAASIFCLLPARDGSLWLGSEGSGLIHYAHGRFETLSASQGLTDGFVRSLLEDEAGQLWIGTDNGLFLLKYGAVRVERVDGSASLRPLAVHAIAEDREHRIWVGGSRLVLLDHGAVEEQKLPGAYSQNRVKSILQTADGTVWVGTVGGLDRMVHGRFMAAPEISGITVRTLRQTSDGTLWIGTIGHGLWTYREEQLTRMEANGLLPSNTALSIYADRDQQVWVGTQAGLVRLSSTPVHVLPLPGGPDADFETISRDGANGLWVVASGVFHVRDRVARRYAFPELGATPVRNVFRNRAGELWVGTDGSGAYHLVPGKPPVHYSAPRELTNNFVRAFLEGRHGDIWIATDEGLSHLTPAGVHKYGVRDGLAYFSTRCLLEDRRGDVWIGTDQGLSHWSGGEFVHDEVTEALRGEKVWSLLEDARGVLWIGTRDHGLFRVRENRLAQFTMAQGLASNSIYEILDNGRGRLWFSGPSTISSVPAAQLDESTPGADLHLNVRTYEMPYGADDAQFYGGRQPSGSVDAEGRVWFPSSKGPVYVANGDNGTPEQHAPPVMITSVAADGRVLTPAEAEIALPAHVTRVEFAFAPLLLRSQGAIRFRYRLVGLDKHWNYAGDARSASYTNLRAGPYRFEVDAFLADSPQASTEASVLLRKEPYYYQTSWFAALCLALAAGTAWAAYHARIRGLRLRFEAVLAERNRLAREMHDTVIQGCTSISALLEAIASRHAAAGENKEDTLLAYARTQVRSTIHEAREAVWNLRHGDEPAHDLLASLETLAANTSRESGVAVECRSEGRSVSVRGSVAHELLMTVREAIYNAILHGRPSLVQVRAGFAPRQLRIRIVDDGVGFEPEQSLSNADTHYGLTGMRERIKRVGGTFRMSSAPGHGTEIDITLKRLAVIHPRGLKVKL